VADRDIQTSNYNINPTYDYGAGTPKITGYQASSNLTIKVRAIDTANGVIDAATAAGATQIGGITFDVDDKTKAQDAARTLAVADAKRKAGDAAKIAGFSLGRIINYSENFGDIIRPMPLMAQTVNAGSAPKTAPTDVSTGSTDITVQVTLSFEIR
jgi:uncharacterized protein YggE